MLKIIMISSNIKFLKISPGVCNLFMLFSKCVKCLDINKYVDVSSLQPFKKKVCHLGPKFNALKNNIKVATHLILQNLWVRLYEMENKIN